MDGDPPSPEPQPEPPPVRRGLLREFTCPSCGGTVTIRAAGNSITAVCSSCDAIIDVTDENFRILSKAKMQRRTEPLIPLGSRGILFGKTWEVIGYMERSDGSWEYLWQEYLLFNPYHGFRWLINDHGHWNFTTMIKDDISVVLPVYEGRTYDKYLAGGARVCYVLGEFYWRVKDGDEVSVKDFIHPPYLLSYEKSEDEEIWSHSVYMEPSEILRAFPSVEELPAREGVAPNQMSLLGKAYPGVMRVFLLTLAALVAIEIVIRFTSRNEVAWSGTVHYDSHEPNKTVLTPKFELKRYMADVVIEMSAPVDNSWLESEIALVNADNDNTVHVTSGVEYYHGVDGGESWSEGSNQRKIFLSSVPAGNYYLAVDTAADARIPAADYTVRVIRDVVPLSNFMLAVLAVSAFPLITWWRRRAFEVKRWSNSDFSPYANTSSDHDD